MNKCINRLKFFLILLSILGLTSQAIALEIPISIFPLDKFEQNVDVWLNPNDPNYRKPLVENQYQLERMKEFYKHYFSSEADGLSPWNKILVQQVLDQSNDLHIIQTRIVKDFSNQDKDAKHIGYGENYKPYPESWIKTIADNMALDDLISTVKYNPMNRAILVQNSFARALPTSEPHFYNITFPGQGYPFDNLQMSSLWAGTPVYIIHQTKDKSWSLVITPEIIGWVKSESLGRVNPHFVYTWQKTAKTNFAAITTTKTPINSLNNKSFLFNGYVGSVFPYTELQGDHLKILVPVKDVNGNAEIQKALVHQDNIQPMPLAATPENFAKILKTLQNRPYGWGGMYFYNDCSQEMKTLYTPFGIWLQRHSSYQTTAGKLVDKSSASMDERLKYLSKNGHPLMTIVYNTGHIFMYMGNYPNDYNSNQQANQNADNKTKNTETENPLIMTYQNLWGLKPEDLSRRAIVGQSLFIPLLKSFKSDLTISSQANNKDFKVVFLDEWPENKEQPFKFDLRSQAQEQ